MSEEEKPSNEEPSAAPQPKVSKAGRPSQRTLAHRKYPWVKTKFGQANAEILPEECADKYGVREDVVMDYITKEIEDEAAVVSLPFQLCLILFYALMNNAHEIPATVRSVEMAVEFDIAENANFAFSGWGLGDEANYYMGHKTFHDVNSFADFWSWMNRGFMPLTNQYGFPTSEVVPLPGAYPYNVSLDLGQLTDSAREHYLWHNRRIGGIRLMQEKAHEIDCLNKEMADKFGITCYDQNLLDLSLPPTEYHFSQTQVMEYEEETKWLNGYDAAGVAALHQLETDGWLNKNTYRIQVSFLSYNQASDLLVISSVNFLFPSSGHIWKDIAHRTMNLSPYAKWETYLFDCLFYGHITIIFLMELKEVVTGLIEHKFNVKAFSLAYFNFWNGVDWISVIMAYIILILWIVRMGLTSAIQDKLLSLKDDWVACDAGGSVPSLGCDALFADFFHQVDDAGLFIRKSNVVTAFYPMCILVRLFKAFAAQPRLGVVTKTMSMAGPDLAHFTIVMGAVFLTFAIMGVAFFGTEFDRFATIERSCMGLFRFLMGDFSIEDMEKAGRPFATFFFMSFMACVLMIMLNMLIAIILDVYVEAKNVAKTSSSFFVAVVDQARRTIQNLQKERIPLDYVVKAYEEHKRTRPNSYGNMVIKPKDFQKAVDDIICKVAPRFEKMRTKETGHIMRDRQANRLVRNAATKWWVDHPEPVDLPEVMEQIANVGHRVDMIEEEILGPELPTVNDWEGPTTESLATLPLKDLLQAASLCLEKAAAGAVFPGSEESLRLGLESAKHMVADLQCSARV